MELAAAQERQQDTLRAAKHRAAELRVTELMVERHVALRNAMSSALEEERARELAAAQERQQANRRAAELQAAELVMAERHVALRNAMSSSFVEMTEGDSPALAQSDSAGRSQDNPAGDVTLREAILGISISEVPSSDPTESNLASGVGQGAEAVAASAQQVLTLADVGDVTGRNEVPESTIGGETTCIVCMERPKTHLAVPCAHQCACGPCAEQMPLCPYCRAPVQGWLEVRVV